VSGPESVRNVKPRLAPSSATPPIHSDSHADFLLDVLIHTSNGSPAYQRAADDLIRHCESLVSSLTFKQLSDCIKDEGASEQKTAEIMDILEPALGGKIVLLLSESCCRPKAIVRMQHNLPVMADSKHGREFTLEARRQLLDTLARESDAVVTTQAEDDNAKTADEKLVDHGDEGILTVLAVAGGEPTGAPCRVSSLSPSPDQHGKPGTTRASFLILHRRQQLTEMPHQEYVPHSALTPSETVNVRMQRRSDMTRQHQESVIFLACMAKLGVRCGAWSGQSTRQDFVPIFGTSNEAQHAVGTSLIVDGEDICLDAYHVPSRSAADLIKTHLGESGLNSKRTTRFVQL